MGARVDLEGTLDAFQDVLYVLRLAPDTGFEFVSDAVTALVGYTPQEHYADPALGSRIVDPRDAASLAKLAQTPVGEPAEALLRWRTKQGQTIWTQHRAVKRARDDGSIVLVGSARDVTDLMLAQQRLEAAQQEYRLLAENAADLVIKVDPSGRINWVSPSAHRLIGLDPSTLIGHQIDDVIEPAYRDALAVALAELSEPHIQSRSVETRVQHRDGRSTWWQVTARRAGDDPATSDLVLALRNVDREISAREAAQSETHRRSAAVASMLDPHLLVRAVRDAEQRVTDLTILDANEAACQVFEASLAGLTGASIARLVPSVLRSTVFDDCVRTLQTGRPLIADAVRVTLSEADVRLDVRAVRVDSESLSVSWRDVTEREAVQDALAASEQQYRLLADHAGDVVVSADGVGLLTYVSPSVYTLLGWTPDELVHTRMRDLVHQDDVEQIVADQGHSTGDRLGSVRGRLRCKDGAYRWVSSVGREITDDAGQVVATIATWRDVQAEVAAEAALEAQRERLQAVLDSELEPHVYLEAVRDQDGTIVDFIYRQANEAACQYMGMTRDTLEGARLLGLLPGQAGSGMLSLYAAAVESGQPLVLDDYAYPHEILEEERRYDIRAVRVGDGLSFAWRDVTERFLTARALAASEKRFKSLVEGAAVGLVVTGPDGEVLEANSAAARILQRTNTDLVGHSAESTADWELVRPDGTTYPPGDHPARAVLESGRALSDMLLGVRDPSGTLRWLNITAVPFVLGGEEPNAVLTSFTDVTATVEAQAVLRRQANTDALTGLMNREALWEELTRDPGDVRGWAVLYCDLDGLKEVNDTCGHAAGDVLVKTAARRIRDCVTENDLVARVGGDEILVVFRRAMITSSAVSVAQDICASVAAPIALDETSALRTTISIGIALLHDRESLNEAITRADAKMYHAKKAGGGGVEV